MIRPRPGHGTGYEVQFVDFDWAGVEGEARYPLTISPTVKWAPGIVGGQLILQAHDDAMEGGMWYRPSGEGPVAAPSSRRS